MNEVLVEKNVPRRTPSWVRTVQVPTTGSRSSAGGDTLTFPIVEDLATLTWLVQLAAIELHVHQWRVDAEGNRLNPDRLVIDLDPGEPASLTECAQVALLVREALADLGLSCTPVTSGSKGRCSWTGPRTRRPRPRSRRIRCADATFPRWPPQSAGMKWQPAPRTSWHSTSSDSRKSCSEWPTVSLLCSRSPLHRSGVAGQPVSM